MNFIKNICVLALSTMALLGCTTGKQQAEEHHHGNLQLTSYSNEAELFAEAHPLVAGEESTILCHLTYLKDFKPVEEGTVTLKINVAGKETSLIIDAPKKAGIYSFTFTPEIEGKASMTVSVSNKRINSTFKFDDLQVFANKEDAIEDAESKENSSANGVSFTKELSWGVDFATTPASRQIIGKVIRTVAQVQPSQGAEETVTAKVDGIVHLSSSALSEGCEISGGQTICTIDASTTVDNLAVNQEQALAEYNRAKAEYDRVKALREDKLVLESDVVAAKAAFESAEANYNSLQRNFKAGSQAASATKGGYLKQLYVTNGQFVTAGTPLAVITQSRTLQLKADVQSSYYSDLKDVTDANICHIDAGADDEVWTLEQLGGHIVSYGHQTETTSPLIPVTFEINNVLDLLPGSFVQMYIKTKSQNEKLVVPAKAVLEEMGNNFVFIQLTPELFEKREVKIGVTDGLHTEILSGLKDGDRVVSRGAMLVKLQQAVGGVDPHSGHTH